jgi:multidrug efflux pump subunit AcrA (membrane-fusion protein)
MRTLLLPCLALIALVFGIVSVANTRPRPATTSPPSPPPESAFDERVAAVGLIEASTENIAVGSHLSGVVDTVYVTVGDAVKRGAPLFRLDVRHVRAELARAEAAEQAAAARVGVAAALLADAKRQLRFVENLSDPRAVSVEEVTRRRSAVETAEARLVEAKAGVRTAVAEIEAIRTDLERSVVTAPTDGEVLQLKLRPGEFADAGRGASPMVLLGRSRPLHLRVDVDEHEAWRVRPEAAATAAVRGNAELKAALRFVRFEPFVVPKRSLTGDSTERVDTRVLQVIYRIEGDGLRLFVGQQMDVFIDAPAGSAPAAQPR